MGEVETPSHDGQQPPKPPLIRVATADVEFRTSWLSEVRLLRGSSGRDDFKMASLKRVKTAEAAPWLCGLMDSVLSVEGSQIYRQSAFNKKQVAHKVHRKATKDVNTSKTASTHIENVVRRGVCFYEAYTPHSFLVGMSDFLESQPVAKQLFWIKNKSGT
ncbi:hypothetical protein L3Q82_009958 [Scortum barcoo]|uniref:Uncharacterized protein n=1 Tax=Scortum barcoo TaxID=214431 RepID=A0ACB8WE80_9TELE|nr:hypothetical protein L3Q82_009958 [Scortum barcoo]